MAWDGNLVDNNETFEANVSEMGKDKFRIE